MSECCVQDSGGDGAPAGSSNVTVLNPPGGTANTIPKWTAATVLADSALSDNGTTFAVANRQSSFSVTDLLSGAVTDIMTVVHNVVAGGANGIGVGLAFIASDSTGALESVGRINALLTNATNGAEASRIDFFTRTGGAAPARSVSVGPNYLDVGTILVPSDSKGIGVQNNTALRFVNVAGAAFQDAYFVDNTNNHYVGDILGAGLRLISAASTTIFSSATLLATFASTVITTTVPITDGVNDAATVTTTDVMTLRHTTSGAAGIAFGVGLLFQLENSTGTTKDASRISTTWLDATAASEDSAIVFERMIAGAAMTTGMTLAQGLLMGTATADPGVGAIELAYNANSGLYADNSVGASRLLIRLENGGLERTKVGNVNNTLMIGGSVITFGTGTSFKFTDVVENNTFVQINTAGELILGAGDAAAGAAAWTTRGPAKTGNDAVAPPWIVESSLGTGQLDASLGFISLKGAIPNSGGVGLQQTYGESLRIYGQTVRFKTGTIRHRTPTAVDYVVLVTDELIGVTSTGTNRAITLPAPAAATAGQTWTIVDEGGGATANNITMTPAAGLINNAASKAIVLNRGWMIVYHDGTNYFAMTGVAS